MSKKKAKKNSECKAPMPSASRTGLILVGLGLAPFHRQRAGILLLSGVLIRAAASGYLNQSPPVGPQTLRLSSNNTISSFATLRSWLALPSSA